MAALWPNFLAAGARAMIVSGIPGTADGVRQFTAAAVPDASVTIIRLRATPETLRERIFLRGRGGEEAPIPGEQEQHGATTGRLLAHWQDSVATAEAWRTTRSAICIGTQTAARFGKSPGDPGAGAGLVASPWTVGAITPRRASTSRSALRDRICAEIGRDPATSPPSIGSGGTPAGSRVGQSAQADFAATRRSPPAGTSVQRHRTPPRTVTFRPVIHSLSSVHANVSSRTAKEIGMRLKLRAPLALLFATLLSASALLTPVSAATVAEQCFPETGYCVQGRFLDYWNAHGGLAVNGYPLTGEFVTVLDDGNAYTVQYFERVRMEYHPANAGTPYEVLLGQFGRRILAHVATAPTAPASPQDGYTFFPETGHNVGPRFTAYWQANGGLAQFGYPSPNSSPRPWIMGSRTRSSISSAPVSNTTRRTPPPTISSSASSAAACSTPSRAAGSTSRNPRTGTRRAQQSPPRPPRWKRQRTMHLLRSPSPSAARERGHGRGLGPCPRLWSATA
ncbi:MAG: hypothetical protein U0841_04605 [Chloroflexia bacterium]